MTGPATERLLRLTRREPPLFRLLRLTFSDPSNFTQGAGGRLTGSVKESTKASPTLRGVPASKEDVAELTAENALLWKANPGSMQTRTAMLLNESGVKVWSPTSVPGGFYNNPSGDFAAAAMLTSVAEAPAVDYPLSRGVSLPEGVDAVVAQYPVGSTFGLGLQGFTDNQGTAEMFASRGRPDSPGVAGITPVIYNLAPGAHALAIENLSNPALDASYGEGEHIAAGTFQVTSVDTQTNTNNGTRVVVGLTQLANITVPPGGF